MKCSDFERVIPQLAGNGLIEAGTQTAALHHAEDCVRCATRLADERMLISGVRAVRAEFVTEAAPVHLEQVLLRAFRERVNTAAVMPMPGRRLPRFNWKIAAIAAAILFAISTGTMVLVRTLSDETLPLPQVNLLRAIPESPSSPPKAIDSRDRVAQVPAPRHRAKQPKRRTETVTEFFPLIEGDDLESLEFTQIVRVELTPSALREVGLPMSYASEGEAVKADLILGQDGLARAIRFVR